MPNGIDFDVKEGGSSGAFLCHGDVNKLCSNAIRLTMSLGCHSLLGLQLTSCRLRDHFRLGAGKQMGFFSLEMCCDKDLFLV